MKKYCTNCGEFISNSDKYCAKCGAPQNWQESGRFFANSPPIDLTIPSPPINKFIKNEIQNASIQKDKYNKCKLSNLSIVAFSLSYIAKTSILLLLFLIGLYFDPFTFGIIIFLYLILIIAVAAIVINNYSFSINEIGFSQWYGVFHKKSISISYNQIHNINISRSIIERFLGLANLNIETSGSSDNKPREIAGGNSTLAEGYLPGVRFQEAKEIHDLLLYKSLMFQE